MVAEQNDTWGSCPLVGRYTILSLGRNSVGDAFDQDRPVMIVGGQARPREVSQRPQPHLEDSSTYRPPRPT